jgi:hypothetical protein
MAKALFSGLFVFVLAGLTLGCSPPVPATPTFTKDVKPIFDAHCVRCHGAGGSLNVVPPSVTAPKSCYLNMFATEGDCTVTSPPCKMGAMAALCFGLAANYIDLPDNATLRMPPLPAEPLNDWEKEVIKTWVKAGAPQ